MSYKYNVIIYKNHLMNLRQISKNKIILSGLIILIIFVVVATLFNKPQNTNKESAGNTIATSTDSIDSPAHSEDFSKYACEFTSNVGWTECIIEKLDIAAAEREWKQRKLEKIKSPEVNEYNMTPELSDEVKKIRRWRETFEVGRDAWCDAKLSFRAGSGTPGGIADCKLEFEIEAIKDLNYLYYDVIVDSDYGKGMPDFEPKESDIDFIVKTNKTTRGCVWAGEEECN